MWRSIGTALVLAALPTSTSADDDFTVGRWTGSAIASTVSAQFDRCSASALDRKNTLVSFSVDRDSAWTMELANPGWHLPPAHHYQLRVSVDSSPQLDWDSLASSRTDLSISLGHDPTLLTMLRRGHSLLITSGGGFKETYDLADSASVFDRLLECQETALATERTRIQRGGNGTTAGSLITAAVAAYALPLLPVLIFGVVGAGRPDGKTEIITLPSNFTASSPVVASAPAAMPIEQPAVLEVPVTDNLGTFEVPAAINGVITLQFVIDSGASDITIPGDVLRTLERAGTVTGADFVGSEQYGLADGSIATEQLVKLRSIKVGQTEIDDIVASIAPGDGSLLLGQGFLKHFASWSIDNDRHVLILRPHPEAPSPPPVQTGNVREANAEAAAASTAAEAASQAAGLDLGM